MDIINRINKILGLQKWEYNSHAEEIKSILKEIRQNLSQTVKNNEIVYIDENEEDNLYSGLAERWR